MLTQKIVWIKSCPTFFSSLFPTLPINTWLALHASHCLGISSPEVVCGFLWFLWLSLWPPFTFQSAPYRADMHGQGLTAYHTIPNPVMQCHITPHHTMLTHHVKPGFFRSMQWQQKQRTIWKQYISISSLRSGVTLFVFQLGPSMELTLCSHCCCISVSLVLCISVSLQHCLFCSGHSLSLFVNITVDLPICVAWSVSLCCLICILELHDLFSGVDWFLCLFCLISGSVLLDL